MNIDEIIKMISFKIESDKTGYVWINKENAQKLLKEIERLNNIIDELEKEINVEYVSCHDVETIAVLNDIMRKLEELKGSDTSER